MASRAPSSTATHDREDVGLPAGVVATPLSPHVGARVDGLDLAAPISSETAEALRALYLRHRLLLIHQPGLDGEDQARFAKIFGETSKRERNKVAAAGNDNQFVSNARPDGIFGKGELDYHMDQLFLEEPLKAIILYAMELPSQGGDTHFVNAEAAYANMPDSLRARIDGQSCLHARAYDARISADWNVQQADADTPQWVHPMAWTDPRTESRCLWVNKLTTIGVVGLEPEDSAALIGEARAYLYDEAITYRHKWRPGDLILWDNLVLQHARTPFDAAETRTLRRTALV